MPQHGGWDARRCRCAVPGCLEGERVFPSKVQGTRHLRERHGIRLPAMRTGDGLVLLDPPIHQLEGPLGHAKDRAPTPEEYARLLEAAEDDLDRLIFRVLGGAGLRRNEFIHLRWTWLKDGKIHVPYEDAESGFRAKTKKAARAIPLEKMDPEAWELLRTWWARRELGLPGWAPRARTRRRIKGGRTRVVWKGPPRSPTPLGICPSTLWRRVRLGGKRAGLPKSLTPHALRAYCATKWAYALGNPFLLMDLFGWTTPGVAMAYVRTSGRAIEDAVEAWNQNQNGHNGGSVPSAGSLRLT